MFRIIKLSKFYTRIHLILIGLILIEYHNIHLLSLITNTRDLLGNVKKFAFDDKWFNIDMTHNECDEKKLQSREVNKYAIQRRRISIDSRS